MDQASLKKDSNHNFVAFEGGRKEEDSICAEVFASVVQAAE
jgi:hypothetical protein